MTPRPNWQRQGGFASLVQKIAPGISPGYAPTVDELLLVSQSAVENPLAPFGRHSYRFLLPCRPSSLRHGLALRTLTRSSPSDATGAKEQALLLFI